jgi:hypothetical protein
MLNQEISEYGNLLILFKNVKNFSGFSSFLLPVYVYTLENITYFAPKKNIDELKEFEHVYVSNK